MKIALHYAPRALGILFTLFIAAFALDVFNEGRGIGEKLAAFAIHLTPAYFIIAALLIAWRWPIAGGLGFVALAAAYIAFMAGGRWDWALIIAAPAVVIGALFLADGFMSRSKPAC